MFLMLDNPMVIIYSQPPPLYICMACGICYAWLIEELYTSDFEQDGLLFTESPNITSPPNYSFCYSEIDVSTVFLSSHLRLACPSIGTCSEQFHMNRTLKTNKVTEIDSTKALKMLEIQELI